MKTTSTARRIVSTLLLAFCLIFIPTAIGAQTSAFTYQGRLSDGSMAASGSYDLQFALFDAETGGTQSGSTLTKTAVNVAGGVFSVSLDFGANPFTSGANRYLEIAVKRLTDTNYTTLTPRQQLTASPFSIQSLSAKTADGLSANCVGCVTNAQIDSVDGAKVSGTVANANTANSATTATTAITAVTANSATTAGNVSGIVAIANGGTGSTTKNFVDTTTDQTIGGNKVFNGVLSGTGISNLVRIAAFNGPIQSTPASNPLAYVFVGPTVSLTVAANQRVTGAATAVFGGNQGPTGANIGLCYQTATNSTVVNFAGNNSQLVGIFSSRMTYSATASVVPGAATLNVGFCIKIVTPGTTVVGDDYVNGWVMVTNN